MEATYTQIVEQVNVILEKMGIQGVSVCRELIRAIKYERGRDELARDLREEIEDYFDTDPGNFSWDPFTFIGESMILNERGDKKRHPAWSPQKNENAAAYMLRIRVHTLSVVDFVYVLLNLNWDDMDIDILGTLNDFDQQYFKFGRHERFHQHSPLKSAWIPKMIEHFFVANLRDTGRVRTHGYDSSVVKNLMAFLCNQVRNAPEVRFVSASTGYGLFARRNYKRGEVITRYGGRIMSHDPAQGLETDEERKEGSAYIVPLAYTLADQEAPYDATLVNGPSEFDFVLDGEICWKLSELGRFVNSSQDAESRNARYKIELLDNGINFAGSALEARDRRAALRIVNVVALVDIAVGQEILTYYGEAYLEQLDIRAPKRLCIQCRAVSVAAKCGGPCGRAIYCGQACANAHVRVHECKGKLHK